MNRNNTKHQAALKREHYTKTAIAFKKSLDKTVKKNPLNSKKIVS